MNKNKAVSSLLITLHLIGYNLAYANPPVSPEKPLVIHSQLAEFNERLGYALYSGKVLIEHGPLSIQAHQVKVLTDTAGTKKVVANGIPAQVEQQNEDPSSVMTAKAKTITYLFQKKLLILDRSAYLVQQGKTFTGDEIRYDLKNQKVIATGSQQEQVKLVIPVEQLTPPKSEAIQ